MAAEGSVGNRRDVPLRHRKLLGVARRRWVVLEGGDGLQVIDGARAALQVALRQQGGGARLLVPARVTLSPDDQQRVLDQVDELASLGLDLAPFGPREVAVKAVPVALVGTDPEVLLAATASALRRAVDVATTWGERMEPPPLDPDPHEVRTLLATLDELGIAPPMRQWRWDELP